MSKTQELGRRIALIHEADKLLEQARKEAYAELAAEIRRGNASIYATDDGVDDDVKLGTFVVPKPKERFVLEDESQAAAWALENIGESAVHMTLSATGKNDVKAAVQKGLDVDWAYMETGSAGFPTFRPTPECGRLVRELLAEGALTAHDLPQIGGGQ